MWSDQDRDFWRQEMERGRRQKVNTCCSRPQLSTKANHHDTLVLKWLNRSSSARPLFQFKFQWAMKSSPGGVRWGEAALTAGSHSGNAAAAAPPAIVPSCKRVWPASIAAVKAALAGSARLLCCWLAARALSGHTAALIASARYNLLQGKEKTMSRFGIVLLRTFSLFLFYLFIFSPTTREVERHLKKYLNSRRKPSRSLTLKSFKHDSRTNTAAVTILLSDDP